MFYFLRRDQQELPRIALRAWVKYSAILPLVIPGLLLLLYIGFSASMGLSPLEAGSRFVSLIALEWSQLYIQLWLTAFFMAVICYGVGPQLIRQTARNLLSAPMAALAARLRRWVDRRISSLCTIASASGPISKVSPAFPTDSVGLAPPVALLSGSAPQLE